MSIWWRLAASEEASAPEAHQRGRLEGQGLMECDVESAWLKSSAGGEEDEATIHHLLGSSITYHIAFGPQQGRKVFTLQTLPYCRSDCRRAINQIENL